ncbi:MAG: response regulator [Nitrospirota bacterium]|nr:response regulator [Nitrospirota bacterium]
MPKRILVVEDDEPNRRLIKDVLMYHGYEVMEAANGDEAVKMAAKHKPDLVLMDLQMPVMNGAEAIRQLKNSPETKGIKIIAVTGFAMRGDRERTLDTGADDYIAKPIDIRELPEVVKHILEGRETRDERRGMSRPSS